MGEIQGLWIYALYLSDIPLFAAPMAVLDQTVSLAHFWSLAVEEQFYLVWPFVLALLVGRRQNAKRTILTLWALSFVFRLGMLALHAPIEWQTEFLLGRAGELLTGAYVAMLVRGSVDERQRLFRRSPWLLGGGLLALGAICVAQGDPVLQTPLMATVGLALCGICGASVVGACLKPGPKPSLLQSFFLLPPLRWLGKVSYGIYVYNLLLRIPLIALSYTIAPNLDEHTGRPALVGMMAVVSVLGVSALSFYTYERFFLGLKERFTQETAA
jgi:peptidoglycan/LPS O-acetylase OafA/YrhL